MKKIAIVGMGVSGMAVLLALDKKYRSKPFEAQIDCFDVADSFGRGFPFRHDADSALLNSPRETISFDHEDIRDFDRWIKDTDHPLEAYYPRDVYGDYERDRLADISLPFNTYMTKVNAIERQGNKFLLTTEEDETKTYDQVHMCCGELPTQDHYHLEGTPHFIRQPYPMIAKLRLQPAPKSIAIIGTGLSAVDVIKYCADHYPQAQLFAFSPSLEFPTSRGQEPVLDFSYLTEDHLAQLVNDHEGVLPYSAFRELFYLEAQNLGIDWDHATGDNRLRGIEGIRNTLEDPEYYGLVQQLAMQVSLVFTNYWHLMSTEDKKTYQQELGTYIKNLRNPMPPSSAKELIDLARSGRLRLLQQPDQIVWKKGQYRVGATAVHWIINATGQSLKPDLLDLAQPILKSLVAHHLVSWDPMGGFQIDFESGQSIDPEGKIVEDLFLHGQLINGYVYQNNSTVKIQARAVRSLAHDDPIFAEKNVDQAID